MLGQRPLDPLVAGHAVGAEVGRDVDPVGPDLARGQRDLTDRVAADHREPAVPLSQRGVEGPQRGGEVGAADGSRRPPERRIEHEERQHVTVGTGLDEGRVVPQAEVAAEPHHGGHRRPPCQPLPPWVRMSR